VKEVYTRVNRVPRLYGIRWVLFLWLLAVLFVSMFGLIKLAGALGILLSFLVTGLLYAGFLLLEQLDRFTILGFLNTSIRRELTSIGGTGGEVC
jgi:hypothetical protein